MRWNVEVAAAAQDQAFEQWVVDAASWCQALTEARELRGDTGPLEGFAIDVLESGWRAVDPIRWVRFSIRPLQSSSVVESPTGRETSGAVRASEPPAHTGDASASSSEAHPESGPIARPPASSVSVSVDLRTTLRSGSERPARSVFAVEVVAPRSVANAVLRPSAPETVASQPPARAPQPPVPGASQPQPPVPGASQPQPPVPGASQPQPPVPGASQPHASRPAPPASPTPSGTHAAAPSITRPSTAPPQAYPQPAPPSPIVATPSTPTFARPRSSAPPAPLFQLPSPQLLYRRDEDPSEASPLTYRESAWLVPEGTSVEMAAALIRGVFEYVRSGIAHIPPGKLINIAIFDHFFERKPQRPPLASLTWKDWRSQEPVIRRLGEPPTSGSAPNPLSAPPGKPPSPPLWTSTPSVAPHPSQQVAIPWDSPVARPQGSAPPPAAVARAFEASSPRDVSGGVQGGEPVRHAIAQVAAPVGTALGPTEPAPPPPIAPSPEPLLLRASVVDDNEPCETTASQQGTPPLARAPQQVTAPPAESSDHLPLQVDPVEDSKCGASVAQPLSVQVAAVDQGSAAPLGAAPVAEAAAPVAEAAAAVAEAAASVAEAAPVAEAVAPVAEAAAPVAEAAAAVAEAAAPAGPSAPVHLGVTDLLAAGSQPSTAVKPPGLLTDRSGASDVVDLRASETAKVGTGADCTGRYTPAVPLQVPPDARKDADPVSSSTPTVRVHPTVMAALVAEPEQESRPSHDGAACATSEGSPTGDAAQVSPPSDDELSWGDLGVGESDVAGAGLTSSDAPKAEAASEGTALVDAAANGAESRREPNTELSCCEAGRVAGTGNGVTEGAPVGANLSSIDTGTVEAAPAVDEVSATEAAPAVDEVSATEAAPAVDEVSATEAAPADSTDHAHPGAGLIEAARTVKQAPTSPDAEASLAAGVDAVPTFREVGIGPVPALGVARSSQTAPAEAAALVFEAPVRATAEAGPLVTAATSLEPSLPSRQSSIPVPRLHGDDLITELFESMHGLHFMSDALGAADFVLSLAMEKLPSRLGMVHLYDIDAREFVVVSATGRGAEVLVQHRTSERDPLIAAAMSRRSAIIVNDSTSELLRNARWAATGSVCKSVLCVPVELGGRFLGVIELANPRDGAVFAEGDGNAVTYMGQQLAEYLATHGIVFSPQRTTK